MAMTIATIGRLIKNLAIIPLFLNCQARAWGGGLTRDLLYSRAPPPHC
jgi:hypothetical protein